MAQKKPLVSYDGVISTLQDGDTLDLGEGETVPVATSAVATDGDQTSRRGRHPDHPYKKGDWVTRGGETRFAKVLHVKANGDVEIAVDGENAREVVPYHALRTAAAFREPVCPVPYVTAMLRRVDKPCDDWSFHVAQALMHVGPKLRAGKALDAAEIAMVEAAERAIAYVDFVPSVSAYEDWLNAA